MRKLLLKMTNEKAAPVKAPINPFLRASETILARTWLFKSFNSSTTEDLDVCSLSDISAGGCFEH